jgi:hypothetical protein
VERTLGSVDDPAWLRRLLCDKFVWLGLAVWAGFAGAIPFLAHGTIPFDQPWLVSMHYSMRVAIWITGPVFALTIIGVTFALTHHRALEIGARAPERSVALRETIGLLIYGAIVLVGGVFLGGVIGGHRIGLHLTGSMFGLADTVTRREVYAWSAYNFVFYAVLPYWFFRRRGYSNEALCLKSSDLRNDILVILGVLTIGLSGDLLPGNRIWSLNIHQIMTGGALAFVLSLFGTGFPVMIFLTAILVPRYKKLTNSTAGAVVLSGFTYASLHLTEYWTRYDTPSHAVLSVIFIVLLFGGPGMVKGYLTLRTGNAWVHLWGFHAIWPHVTDDTPIFVKIFGIR